MVSQARMLFVRITEQRQLMEVLQQTHTLFASRNQLTQTALERGLLTLTAVTPHLVALHDVSRQINDLERLMSQSRHDLNFLLGIAPEVAVPLAGPVTLPELDDAAIVKLLPDLPRRRPDLIALQAGYAAEDQRYRAAIRAQFPAVIFGFSRILDATDVRTAGMSVVLNLPLFNGNRGFIAIEEATRQQLHVDYEQRLNAANSVIDRIALIADAHRAGLSVHVWTMRSDPFFLAKGYASDAAAEWRRFAALGVDGIFGDFPDVGVKALTR